MSTDVLIGDGEAARLTPHPLRAAVLGEVHARPFTPIAVPSRVVHFAFDTSGSRAQADRVNLIAFCTSRGLQPPSPAEKHHRVPFGTTALRWEQHSEFTTYTWEMPADPAAAPFHPDAASLALPMRLVPQPGPLLVAVDLHLLTEDLQRTAPERLFDKSSLAVAENSDGAALYATDFQPGPSGFAGFLEVVAGVPAGVMDPNLANLYLNPNNTPALGINFGQLLIAPTLTYKITPNHAIGAGPVIGYQTFRGYGLGLFQGFSSDPGNVTNNGNDNAWGVGGQIGYQGHMGMFSFGLMGRSKIYMDEFDDYAGLFAEQGDFDIPATFGGGIAVHFGSNLTIAADVSRILYGDVKAINNNRLSPLFHLSTCMVLKRPY